MGCLVLRGTFTFLSLVSKLSPRSILGITPVYTLSSGRNLGLRLSPSPGLFYCNCDINSRYLLCTLSPIFVRQSVFLLDGTLVTPRLTQTRKQRIVPAFSTLSVLRVTETLSGLQPEEVSLVSPPFLLLCGPGGNSWSSFAVSPPCSAPCLGGHRPQKHHPLGQCKHSTNGENMGRQRAMELERLCTNRDT